MATWTYISPCEIEQWMSQTWHIALGAICPGNEPKACVYYFRSASLFCMIQREKGSVRT
jgi:hypothetical protein